MKIFLSAFSFFFSTLLFAKANESKLTTPTHNKKFNYSFSLALCGIRIDEKHGWDSLRRFNYGLGINVSYKNTLSNEFQFYGNINAYNRFFLGSNLGKRLFAFKSFF